MFELKRAAPLSLLPTFQQQKLLSSKSQQVRLRLLKKI